MLSVENVSKQFRRISGTTQALDGVSLTVPDGQIVGLVGESGSGKTTLLRCVVGLEKPDSGSVQMDCVDIQHMSRRQMKHYRRQVQMVYQDPRGSLDPRHTVEALVGEGLVIHRLAKNASERRQRVGELLELVGIDPRDMTRRIASFSGGQQQRVAIARALAVGSDLLVCDEPTSALDVSVQAQILNLLKDLQARLGLSVLFVSHDLAVVRYLCSEVNVLYAGKIVEHGTIAEVFSNPQNTYTRQLMAAVPTM